MSKYSSVKELFSAICDAIRAKDGTTEVINHEDIPERIGAISTGASQEEIDEAVALARIGNATESNVLSGMTFTNESGSGKIGTMPNNGAFKRNLPSTGYYLKIPAGYHNGEGFIQCPRATETYVFAEKSDGSQVDLGEHNLVRYIDAINVRKTVEQKYDGLNISLSPPSDWSKLFQNSYTFRFLYPWLIRKSNLSISQLAECFQGYYSGEIDLQDILPKYSATPMLFGLASEKAFNNKYLTLKNYNLLWDYAEDDWDIRKIYYGANVPDVDFSAMSKEKMFDLTSMFYDSTLKNIRFGPNVSFSKLENAFSYSKIEEIDFSPLGAVQKCSCRYMFSYCQQLTKIIWGNKLAPTDLSGAFSGCSSLTEIDFGDCDLSNCKSLSIDGAMLQSVKNLDCSAISDSGIMTTNEVKISAPKLTSITFKEGGQLGDCATTADTSFSLNLRECTSFDVQGYVDLIASLPDTTKGTYKSANSKVKRIIKVSSALLDKLSAAQKKLATNKGYSVESSLF